MEQSNIKRRSHTNAARARWMHVVRVAIVIGLLLAIPSPQRRIGDHADPPKLGQVQKLLASATAIDPVADSSGLWTVRDERETAIAKVARTLPHAKDVVGYRGPSEALLLIDEKRNITQVDLLGSSDTIDHVAAVRRSPDFFQQFVGWNWQGPHPANVDAVSGATLTSFAIAEGIMQRIGGDRPSLVFPNPITDAERAEWLGDDADSQSLIRTGPLSDDISGYQGPTELLIKTDGDTVKKVRLRYSYDNGTYVGYVAEDEWGFWPIFEGKTFQELAALNLEAEGIEGVSGATMTSMSVAKTMIQVAKVIETKKQSSATASSQSVFAGMRWQIVDTASIVLLFLLFVMRQLAILRGKWLRRSWLVAVVVAIGLWAGNLVSLALIAGWSAEGVAWKLAPGLAAIAFVAIVFPPMTKSNPYCNHLCPHGAMQQLVRPGAKSKRNQKLPAKLQKTLRWLPGVTLVFAYLVILIWPTSDLSSFEPFHAYLFRIAGWGSLAFAIGTLAFSALVPMGYCRLGCPTGRLIDHLRRNANSHKIQLADVVSVVLLIVAISLRQLDLS